MNRDTAPSLRTQLRQGPFLPIIGVHDGVTALLAQGAGFEALWAGSFAISTAYGLPDAGLLTMTEMHAEASRIRRASSLPLIVDVDAGSADPNVVQRMVRLYEDSGVDAICMEDKQYPKRNSFRGGNVLEEPCRFADRLATALAARTELEFLVIARIESFIADAGLDDALQRARLYRAAGADALVIHSRSRGSEEIASFCAAFAPERRELPLLAIPTTYFQTDQTQLRALGLSGAIYANQVLRAEIRASERLLRAIAEHGGTATMEPHLTSISEIFELVNTDRLVGDDPWQQLDEAWRPGQPPKDAAAENGRGEDDACDKT
jgi:phosphoenolpyruvate phosphomutase